MLIPGSVPVLFSSEFSIESGETIIPNIGALTSPYSAPLLIDRVIIGLYCQRDAISYGLLSQAVRAKFALDRMEIAKDFVGLINYSAPHSPITLDHSGVKRQSVNYGGSAGGGFSPTIYEWVPWILPKPIFLQPGSVLKPTFTRPAGGPHSENTIFGEIAISGVRLPPGYVIPAEIDVPFVSSFATGVIAANGIARSIEPALQNGFNDKRVDLQRITLYGGRNATPFGPGDPFGPQIYLKHSGGFEITDGYVPLYEAVDQNRRAWNFSGVALEPKESIVAIVRDSGLGTTDVEIAVIGSRKERI